MVFKIGDKITCIDGYGCSELKGKQGKVIAVETKRSEGTLYSIEFPFQFEDGHDGIGSAGKNNQCRNMYEEHIKKPNIFKGKSRG